MTATPQYMGPIAQRARAGLMPVANRLLDFPQVNPAFYRLVHQGAAGLGYVTPFP